MTRDFCWHQNFVPWGCPPLTCGYIHLLNHEKICIKSEVEGFFVNLQQMTIVMKPTCWHKNFGPNGLSAPAQGLCLNVFSSITADFNISSAIRWAIQDQWSSGVGALQRGLDVTFIKSWLRQYITNESVLLQSPWSSTSASISVSKVHISTATHQKAFIFGPYVL